MGNKGWECPRCGKIWAPWVECCECTKQTTTTTISQQNVTLPNNITWGTTADNTYVSAKNLGYNYSVSNSLTGANTAYTLTSNKYIKEKK